MSSDGETIRAQMCARIWAGVTAAERVKLKTPAALLPVVDDLLKRSIALGSPYEDGVARVLLDQTPYAVVRFQEWLTLQSPELQALYRDLFTTPPA